MANDLYGVSGDKIEALVRKITKQKDSYAKMNVLEEYGVDWGDREPLLWALVREGHYAAWDDPAIWGELNDAHEHATATDWVDFLTKVQRFDAVAEAGDADDSADSDDAYDDYGDEYYDDEYYEDEYYDDYEEPLFESHRLVSFWPVALDMMAMRAYAEDPELVESRVSDMIPDVQKGLELVRRRFATNGIVDLPEGTVAELAHTSVWSSLPWIILDVEGQEMVQSEIGRQDADGEAALEKFLSKFTTQEEWGRAVLEAVFAEDYGPSFRNALPAWPHASLEQLGQMIQRISIYGADRVSLYEILRGRKDTPQALLEVAGVLKEERRDNEAEMVAIAATLRARDEGEKVPAGALPFFEFQALDSVSKRSENPPLAPMVQALSLHDEDAVVARFEAVFESEYGKLRPFPALYAFAHRDELVDAAFAALEADLEDRGTNFYGLSSVVQGLSFMGVSALPQLAERWDATTSPAVKQVIRRGVIGVIADAEKPTDEAYDRFVSITDLDAPAGDHEVGHYLMPDYLEALETIGGERAALIVARDLSSDRWIRTVPAVAKLARPELFDRLFGRLAKDGLPASDGFNFAGPFYEHDFKEAARPYVGTALAASDNPDFHNLIKQRFGDDAYDEILASAGGKSAADSGPADRLRRLSRELFEKRPDLERTTVYIFGRVDEPDDTMNRIGGRPFGVTQETWPRKGGDDDQPMTHMFTLDLDTVPALKERFAEDVRAVSLFLHNPQYNSAWSPGTDETDVVVVTRDNAEAFGGDIPTADEAPAGFTVDEVQVPLEAWSVEYGSDSELEQIRSEIYKQGAWVGGGGPIWLQGEEHFGLPVMQFDESFIYTNLGDSGIMYVFADTAFWQCH